MACLLPTSRTTKNRIKIQYRLKCREKNWRPLCLQKWGKNLVGMEGRRKIEETFGRKLTIINYVVIIFFSL